MEETKVVYCTNCGTGMNEEAEFCTSCGVRQGRVINFCYNCSGEIQPNQEICLKCGVNPKKVKRGGAQKINMSQSGSNDTVNVTIATILGYIIPGLPSILWYNQKTKGITMIVVWLLLWLILPIFSNILFGVLGAVDAYQLGKRVNNGEKLNEWTFFWDK